MYIWEARRELVGEILQFKKDFFADPRTMGAKEFCDKYRLQEDEVNFDFYAFWLVLEKWLNQRGVL